MLASAINGAEGGGLVAHDDRAALTNQNGRLYVGDRGVDPAAIMKQKVMRNCGGRSGCGLEGVDGLSGGEAAMH
jgi:hypothetical protein